MSELDLVDRQQVCGSGGLRHLREHGFCVSGGVLGALPLRLLGLSGLRCDRAAQRRHVVQIDLGAGQYQDRFDCPPTT